MHVFLKVKAGRRIRPVGAWTAQAHFAHWGRLALTVRGLLKKTT
jgi:hypothetical protein